jgi:hypothetical protein
LLPKQEQFVLAVKLFGFKELEFDERLLPGFPFLRIESDPETARQWLLEHSIAEWPLRADPCYGKTILRFLKAGQEHVPLDGLGKVDLAQWVLIFRNVWLFDRGALRDYLADPEVRHKLKRIRDFTLPRKFLPIEPTAVSPEPSATPFLRRGILLDTPGLVDCFLKYSTVTVPVDIIDQAVVKCRHLAPSAEAYLTRTALRAPAAAPVDILQGQAQFSTKSKFLRAACVAASPGPLLELRRMCAFQRLAELESDKQWFYFLRFLRLSLVVDPRKTDAYRRNTSEWLKDIFSALKNPSAASLAELCRLMQALLSPGGIGCRAQQFAQSVPVLTRPFQDGDYFTEIPSVILDVIAHAALYPRLQVTRLIEERRPLILSNFVLAERVFRFLCENTAYIGRTEPYLSALLDPTLPLFHSGAPLLPLLFERCDASLRSFAPAISALPVCGYLLSSAMEVSAAFYRAMFAASGAGEAPLHFEFLQIGQLTELFLANPTLDNGSVFSRILGDARPFLDSLDFMFSQLTAMTHGFITLLLMMHRYFKRSAAVEQGRFGQLLGALQTTPASRKAAIERMTEQRLDEAFWLALAETDDEEEIARIDAKLARF